MNNEFDIVYQENLLENIPWYADALPQELQELVDSEEIKPCRLIELGCGTGNHLVHLARLGFDVTGVDRSETAINIAKSIAQQKEVFCRYMVVDVLEDIEKIRETFDIVYDWKVLHHIFPPHRERYIGIVSRLLHPGGKYITASFNQDPVNFGGKGLYRKTPIGPTVYCAGGEEMTKLFQPFFEIEESKTINDNVSNTSNKLFFTVLMKR